ncbi:MAG: PEP-CTERM sorting domain-containing protein [Planctomycetota bacterium]|nr:PEP-CTERM sorting domain-containing protein [Planctomycetota bacterium]
MRHERFFRAAAYVGVILALAAPAAGYDVFGSSRDGTGIPDVDKPDRDGNGSWPDANDNSCWAVAAANCLGAAGWGVGAGLNATAQQRADRIYGQLCGKNAWQACGNAGQAMQNWIAQYGQNPASGDYDAKNIYTNVNIVPKTLGQPDYNKLLSDLAIFSPKYSTVLFHVGNTEFAHFLTLVGGDHDNANPPANNKLGVWHDSDKDAGGLNDNAYTNNFGNNGGKWDLPGYLANPLLAADEYDQVTKWQLVAKVVPGSVFYHGRYWDPATGLPGYCTSGSMAGVYGDPTFESAQVLHVGGLADPNKPETIQLTIDYAGSANMTLEQQIYLLDDQNNHIAPTLIDTDPDYGQVLFQWDLAATPPEFRVVFPSDKYDYLTMDPANGKDVIGWRLVVPEPLTLSLLALGGLVPILSGRRRRRTP